VGRWTDSRSAVERSLDAHYDKLRSLRIVTDAVIRGQAVSKLASIADRMKAKKLAHDAKADEWAKRLDAMDQHEPQAFSIGDALLAEREADLAQMEADLRGLSNLPLDPSRGSDG
jgi:hypothetical protein